MTNCSGKRDLEGDDVCPLPAIKMIWTLILTVLPPLSVVPAATAQSLMKISHFEKNIGMIGRGYDDGIRACNELEVNR